MRSPPTCTGQSSLPHRRAACIGVAAARSVHRRETGRAEAVATASCRVAMAAEVAGRPKPQSQIICGRWLGFPAASSSAGCTGMAGSAPSSAIRRPSPARRGACQHHQRAHRVADQHGVSDAERGISGRASRHVLDRTQCPPSLRPPAGRGPARSTATAKWRACSGQTEWCASACTKQGGPFQTNRRPGRRGRRGASRAADPSCTPAASGAGPGRQRQCPESSRPTERRIMSSPTPAPRSDPSDGWSTPGEITRVFASPTLARCEASRHASMKRGPRIPPPLTPKLTIEPAPFASSLSWRPDGRNAEGARHRRPRRDRRETPPPPSCWRCAPMRSSRFSTPLGCRTRSAGSCRRRSRAGPRCAPAGERRRAEAVK